MKSLVKKTYKLTAMGAILSFALFAFAGSAFAYTGADFTAFDGVNIGTNSYTLSSDIIATYISGTGTESDPVKLALTGHAPIVTPWFGQNWTTYNYVAIGIRLPATGFVGTQITGGTAVYQADVMRYDDPTNFPNGYYTVGYGSVPLATQGAALGYLNYEFAANSNNTKKDGLVKLKVVWNTDSAPEYFTIDINGLQLDTATHKFVSTIGQLTSTLAAANSGDTITLTSDITTPSQIIIGKAITLDGDGHKLFAPFAGGSGNVNNSAININSSGVTIKNLTVDGTSSTGIHGINIYNVTGVDLDNVTVTHNSKSGITVNSSTVIVNNVTTNGNAWGGINVDQKVTAPASLTVNGVSSHTETNADIWVDDNTKSVTVNDSNHQYSHITYTHTDSHGTFIGTVYKLLAVGQTTPDESGTATVTDTNKDVVVASSTQPITIDVGDVAGATINFDSLVTGGTGTIPPTTINSNVVDVEIPATTITSSDPTWNGTINLPKIITTTVEPTEELNITKTVVASIEVGYGDTHITFSDPVKLTFAGQAGSSIGWSQNGVFHSITNTCGSATSPTLDADSECKIDSGSDLIVWTKHFTTFTTYTQSATPIPPAPQIGGSRRSSGGGGTGGFISLPSQASPVAVANTGRVLGVFTGPEGSNIDSPAISAIKAQIIVLIKELIKVLQGQLVAAIAAGQQ